MNRAHCSVQLTALLDEAGDAAARLQEALAAERQALTDRNTETLAAAGELKLAQLTRLQAFEAQRQRLVAEVELDENPSFDAVLEWCDDPALTERWETVRDQVRNCQEANDVNGALVRRQRDLVQRTLDVLDGGVTSDPLYDPNGTTHRHTTGRAIAKA